MGGGLMQLVGNSNELPNWFTYNIKTITLGRIYNTFEIVNKYDDDYYKTIIIPNFYDDNFNF